MSTNTKPFVKLSPEALAKLPAAEQLAYYRQENAILREDMARPKGSTLTLKVSEKGAVSLYGMGKFPVTLYGEQWAKVAAFMPEIQSFLEANKALLKTKADKAAAVTTA